MEKTFERASDRELKIITLIAPTEEIKTVESLKQERESYVAEIAYNQKKIDEVDILLAKCKELNIKENAEISPVV